MLVRIPNQFIFLTISFCFMAMAAVDASSAVSGHVTEYGFYQTIKETTRSQNDKNPSGYQRSGGEAKLVKQTQLIPLIKGLLFGFKFTIKGFPRDQVTAELTLKVQHPIMTRPDGSTRTQYSYPIALHVSNGEINEKTGYKFDKNFEMVAGEWRFEYWNKDKKVLTQIFTVVKSNSTDGGLLKQARESLTPETNTVIVNTDANKTTASAKPTVKSLQPLPNPIEAKASKASTSNKLSPEFQKKISTIMNKFKSDKTTGNQKNVQKQSEAQLTSHGPVTSTQTRAGSQAAISSFISPKSEMAVEDAGQAKTD